MWIDKNQLGRRNLTPNQLDLVMYRIYERKKLKQGGQGSNQYKKEQSGQNDHIAKGRTREIVGKELGVSTRTVGRAAEFGHAIDSLGELGEQVKKDIKDGKKVFKEHVIAAGKAMNEGDEEKAKQILEHGTKPVQQGAVCMNSGS
jgi:hypothetical protein